MDYTINKKIEDLTKVVKDFITIAKDKNSGYELICKDIKYIKNDITEIKSLISEKYVTKVEFDPIKNLVFGLVAVIMLSVVAGLMTLLLK